MSPQADIALPFFQSRTRSFLDEDRAAKRALKMHNGIDMLDFALEDPSEDPAQVFSVVQQALEIAVDVIANADDSLGMLSEVVEELIELHVKSAQRAKPAPMELAEWFIDFHESNEVDYYDLDPGIFNGPRRRRTCSGASLGGKRRYYPPPVYGEALCGFRSGCRRNHPYALGRR